MSTKYTRKIQVMSTVTVQQAPQAATPPKVTKSKVTQMKHTIENAAGKTVAGAGTGIKFVAKVLSVGYHTPIALLDKLPSAVGGVFKAIGSEAKKAWDKV